LLGLAVQHQVVAIELATGGAFASVASSNALREAIGAW
jgi:hypothetical protein